jgi:hypothetical protein
MFRASSCPSPGATTTAVAASGLPSELGDSSAVGRGRADWPDHDQQHCIVYDGARFTGEQLLALFEIRIETCVNSHVILSLYTEDY